MKSDPILAGYQTFSFKIALSKTEFFYYYYKKRVRECLPVRAYRCM